MTWGAGVAFGALGARLGLRAPTEGDLAADADPPLPVRILLAWLVAVAALQVMNLRHELLALACSLTALAGLLHGRSSARGLLLAWFGACLGAGAAGLFAGYAYGLRSDWPQLLPSVTLVLGALGIWALSGSGRAWMGRRPRDAPSDPP